MRIAIAATGHTEDGPKPEGRKPCVLTGRCVRKNHRGRNTGRHLMHWVAMHALENGCGRLDWSVKAPNIRGMAF